MIYLNEFKERISPSFRVGEAAILYGPFYALDEVSNTGTYRITGGVATKGIVFARSIFVRTERK